MRKTETQLQQLAAGTQKDLPATSSVDVNGQELKQSDVLAKLQSWIGLFQGVSAAKAAYGNAQQALKASEPDIREFIVGYGQTLRQVFGKKSTLLADFGLTVAQRKTLTAEQQVLAAARRAATLTARGTLTKAQKKALKGTVTKVTVPTGALQADSSVSSQVVNPVASSNEPAVTETSAGVIPAASSASGK